MTFSPAAESAALEWDESGQPRSRRFGDIYFSQQDGFAESRAVFLQGCDLPQAWRDRRHFIVGELGFGTGLNIAALLDLWRRERPPGGRLHIFSVEAYPVARADAERALSAWPEIGEAVAALLENWPDQRRGFRRVALPPWNVTFDLAVMEAAEALNQWSGPADAWFLDGFAPSANPEMWRDEVLDLVAARSAPDARLATFTVAGAVRRALQSHGMSVEKRPGFGRKRERLEARTPGPRAQEAPPPTVAVIGAGIAGAAVARSLRAAGLQPLVIASQASAPAASLNPAALVSPRLDAGEGDIAAFSAQAFRYAIDTYRHTASAVLAQGALQLESSPRDAGRFDALATSATYADCGLQRVQAEVAAERLGEPSGSGGLWLDEALTIEPAAALTQWLNGVQVLQMEVGGLRHHDNCWEVLDGAGREIATVDHVVVAGGSGTARLVDLQLQPVRGQVSFATAAEPINAAAWGGYVIPWRDGLLFGATHDREDCGAEVRHADHERNLAALASRRPLLAATLAPGSLQGRAGVRAASPDRLPVAGAAPGLPGVFVLGGLGGRGFTFAPLLAEHIAALVCELPSPLPAAAQALVEPDRFRLRQQRRAQAR